jgi:hypothetical protein
LETTHIENIAKQLLSEGTNVRIKLEGISMYPFLRAGGYAVLAKIGEEGLLPGDIVAFEQNGKFVLHRFHYRKGDFIFTKGDAMKQFDQAVDFHLLLGVLVSAEYGNKKLFMNSAKSKRISRFSVRFPLLRYYQCRFFLRFI